MNHTDSNKFKLFLWMDSNCLFQRFNYYGQKFTGIEQTNSNKFVWFISMDGFKLSISMNQFNKSISKVSKELIHWNGQRLMCLSMSDSHLWFCVISISLTLKDVIVKDSNWWLTCSIRSLIKVLLLMNGKVIWENLTAALKGNHRRRRGTRHVSLMGRSRVWLLQSFGSDLCFVSRQVPERLFETVSERARDFWFAIRRI